MNHRVIINTETLCVLLFIYKYKKTKCIIDGLTEEAYVGANEVLSIKYTMLTDLNALEEETINTNWS